MEARARGTAVDDDQVEETVDVVQGCDVVREVEPFEAGLLGQLLAEVAVGWHRFDDVDPRRYRDAIASSPVGVDVEWTRGLTPALPYPTRTALVAGRATEQSRLLTILRPTFLVAVVVFAWLGLRGRLDEVGDALRDTSPAGMVGGMALVLLGLGATGLLWLRLMSALGARLPTRDGLATFFVGQLGKYIPGSVWSIGAQAQMARARRRPGSGHGRRRAALPRLPRRHRRHRSGSITMLSGSLRLAVARLAVGARRWSSRWSACLPPVGGGIGRRVAGREVAVGPRGHGRWPAC